MLETSARLLRLLSLLQARRDWTSAELATRLGVTTRPRPDLPTSRATGHSGTSRLRSDSRAGLTQAAAWRPLAARARRIASRRPRRPAAAR